MAYLRVPGGLNGTFQKVVQGYLGGFASLMTNENLLDSTFAPDARLYNLETMKLIKNVESPQDAIDTCKNL